VQDVVRACILASKSRSTGVFNVARGERTSLNQLLKMLGRITGREVLPRYSQARAGDIRHSLADISKAEGIGYRPGYMVEEGLRRTVEWFSGA
jgi:nucleoside-diphosphate-sugar epimerase